MCSIVFLYTVQSQLARVLVLVQAPMYIDSVTESMYVERKLPFCEPSYIGNHMHWPVTSRSRPGERRCIEVFSIVVKKTRWRKPNWSYRYSKSHVMCFVSNDKQPNVRSWSVGRQFFPGRTKRALLMEVCEIETFRRASQERKGRLHWADCFSRSERNISQEPCTKHLGPVKSKVKNESLQYCYIYYFWNGRDYSNNGATRHAKNYFSYYIFVKFLNSNRI